MKTSKPVAVETFKPLAERLRPANLDEYIGQSHLVAPGKPLYQAIKAGRLHSMIFWGPPGTGKTTLARIIAKHADAHFLSLPGCQRQVILASAAAVHSGSGANSQRSKACLSAADFDRLPCLPARPRRRLPAHEVLPV